MVYLIQLYMIKFVKDLRQVCGFLRIFWFPPLIKLTAKVQNQKQLYFEIKQLALNICI
jgi:hypothetical protein